MNFIKKTPCSNCPYREGAPLKFWHKEEYEKLLNAEKDQLGKIYGCHKKDGHTCVGWLMKQDENYFPSIMLRISLSKNNVTREYLNSLHCKSPLYESVKEMVQANYPELITE